MAHPTSLPPRPAADAPLVRLELRHGAARPSWHDVTGEEFLIGSVPGCDLRVPGTNLPPIICQIVRRSDGVRVRKLAPTQPVLLNGQPVVTQAVLAHGDCIQIGPIELHIGLALPESAPRPAAEPSVSFVPLPATAPSYRPAAQGNDVWQQHQADVKQFREQVARFEERRRLTEADEQRQRQALEGRQHQLDEETRELEADRILWYRRREEVERESREQAEKAAAITRDAEQRMAEVRHQEQALEQHRLEVSRILSDREQIERERREITRLRAEAAAIQQDVASRVQASREQIATQEQGLQRDRQQLDAQIRDFTARVEQFAPRLRSLDERERAVRSKEEAAARFDQDRAWQEAELRERQQRQEAHEADLHAREVKLAEERQAIEQIQNRYHGDLVRIDRTQSALDERQKEIELRYEQMQRDAGELEDQARVIDENQERLREESAHLARQKNEQDTLASSLAERAATLEGQQAMLAALRTRLERMREEMRQQSQQLATERSRQETAAAELQERLQRAEKLKTELDEEDQGRTQQRAGLEERSASLQAAISKMKALQEQLEAESRRQEERGKQLDAQGAEQAEQAALMRARAQQIVELQQRLEADRQSLRERETVLSQAEEARKSLQEQLRRRGEELAARAKEIEAQGQHIGSKESNLEQRRQQAEQDRNQAVKQFEQLKQDLETRAGEIQRLNAALTQREDNLRRQVDRLKEAGLSIATERKALFEAKTHWESEQTNVVEQMSKARSELEAFRAETIKAANELAGKMPELELRSQGAIEQLTAAREQLRGHLNELHSYARQSQEDLQELRTQVQAEAERLRAQELALHRTRSEHRLSVTAFRQQLIDWQGRLGDMKQFFSQNESRLELKQQAVEQAAKVVDESTKELARQAETLQQQQREVAERKTEVERHLGDMREWYRQKLRDLAGGAPAKPYTGEVLELPTANAVNDPISANPATGASGSNPDILTITGEVDPGDRKLGELLLALGLVDQDMLLPLWQEARRQRRSLRQILLSSGAITLYQLALIEAGNLDALMLGSLRVIDRVQATSHETLYRVFDPERGSMALLRHLAEAEMADAVRPDEYRQRFGAAVKVPHPNLAATFAVREIAGRPAVLQEWVSGLASPDWPALAAAPGVWYRLLGQAALGMQAAHNAGLTHGRLAGHSVVLTAEGVVKVAGLGEPAWLSNAADPADGVTADLVALGRLAADWSMLVPRRKTSKPKAFPEVLQNIIRRLGAASFNGLDGNDQPLRPPPFPEDDRYPSVTALLEDLEQAGADLPPNSEAWDRLVKHVGENATEGAALRRTA
ncbi:MAG: hypothetical protein ACJ8F7_16610 [Gemmataceae bacterium]